MKKLLTALFAAASLGAGSASAQMINCYGGYCSGTTQSGQSVNLHTYGGYTSGTIGGQSVQMNTYGGHTSGTIGGQSFSCNSYGGYTRCY